ncbi:hypothetical protein [Flavobacterium sp. J27]|uniref:hypothetical protein n=1 Tax=Flavobacterium sp. J27 TaxID=2060419 RepID=UPI0010315334|nr:hypothetical protein [Flavobacterium sp. J27]
MSLVFGWYSFKIKSYTAKDLQLNMEEWKESDFEVRQKVFHLFWIPFFSLGKIYAVRKQGKLYEIPHLIITKINNKDTIRTPWYSFLLPILLITIPIITGVYIYIAESIMRHNHYNEDAKSYEIATQEVQHKLASLSENAYLRISNPQKPNDDITVLKLIAINNDYYSFVKYRINVPKYSNETYSIVNWGKDTLTFTKQELQQAICTDYDVIEKRESYGVKFIGNEKYIIEAIHYFDSPIIDGKIDWYFWDVIRKKKFQYYNSKFTGFKNDRSWSFKIMLQNFGIPVNLIKIESKENNVQWVDSLPIKINSYKYLETYYIEANTSIDPEILTFQSKFIFEDSLNNQYEYMVSGENSWYEIDKIEKTR